MLEDKGRSEDLRNLSPAISEVVGFSNNEGKRSPVSGCRFLWGRRRRWAVGRETVEEGAAQIVIFNTTVCQSCMQ